MENEESVIAICIAMVICAFLLGPCSSEVEKEEANHCWLYKSRALSESGTVGAALFNCNPEE